MLHTRNVPAYIKYAWMNPKMIGMCFQIALNMPQRYLSLGPKETVRADTQNICWNQQALQAIENSSVIILNLLPPLKIHFEP